MGRLNGFVYHMQQPRSWMDAVLLVLLSLAHQLPACRQQLPEGPNCTRTVILAAKELEAGKAVQEEDLVRATRSCDAVPHSVESELSFAVHWVPLVDLRAGEMIQRQLLVPPGYQESERVEVAVPESWATTTGKHFQPGRLVSVFLPGDESHPPGGRILDRAVFCELTERYTVYVLVPSESAEQMRMTTKNRSVVLGMLPETARSGF